MKSKTVILSIPFTKAERTKIERAAKVVGMSVDEFAIWALRGAARKEATNH